MKMSVIYITMNEKYVIIVSDSQSLTVIHILAY